MTQEQISKVELSIKNLKEKNSKIFFIVQDTKGNAKASISYIYRLALTLKNAGYNPVMLHEKPDYVGVNQWLGDEYMSLPHRPIEGQNLEIAPEDFLVIPELYGFVMPQVANLPCGKIVLTQAYDHMLETLQPGQTWMQFGFLKCITTSEFQKEYLSNVMRNISYDILTPYISDNFTKPQLPPKPIIAIHSRDQRDTANIIKSFYLKFPQYRWVSFRDMRGLSEKEFAKTLQDCFLSVWIDETSGYGTYPLESMKSGVPVVGLVPHLQPHWMNENNGIWLGNKNQIVDYVADFLQNWLEDNINQNLFVEMQATVDKLSSEETFNEKTTNLFDVYRMTRLNSFTEQLNKFTTIEQE